MYKSSQAGPTLAVDCLGRLSVSSGDFKNYLLG